jgi:phosphatidylglycerophosphate synthase
VFLHLFGKYYIVSRITARFLPWNMAIVLLCCHFCQVIIGNWAYYLRAHKQEPYMAQAIAAAPISFIGILFAGKLLPVGYFFLGYVFYYVVFTPVNFITYQRCRKKWHDKGKVFEENNN